MTARAPRGGRRPDGELDPFTLRAAQRGERRAQRRLVDHHARSVFGVLSRILSPAGKGGLVEDLAQETMLRVLGSIERFDPSGPAKLSTWILTIAARLAVQELQRRKPSMVSADAQAVDRLVDGPAASPSRTPRRVSFACGFSGWSPRCPRRSGRRSCSPMATG